MHEERRPGWYPEPGPGGRFRYWDDDGWHGVTSSAPVWGRVGSGRPGTSRRRSTASVVLTATVLLVAVAGTGWLVVARGSGDGDATAPPAASVPLVSVSAASDCGITGAEFAAALDTPRARRTIGDQHFADVRCTHNLASARTEGGLIAVVREDPSGWVLAALGDDSPCLALELPSDITTALAC